MGKYKIMCDTMEFFKIAVGLFEKLGFENNLGAGFRPFLIADNGEIGYVSDYMSFIKHPNRMLSIGELSELADPVQKEYLQKLEDGTYKLVVMSDVVDGHKGLIEVPEGADFYAKDEMFNNPCTYFYKDNSLDRSNGAVYINSDWQRCLYNKDFQEILWERVEYDQYDINLAIGADLDAIGKSLGSAERLPWISDQEYRKQLLRIDGTGLKHIGVECVVLGDDEIKATSSDIGFSLADGYVNAFDTQVGGNHYKDLAIQPMQYALANRLDYAQANVVKYVTRHALKNGKEDLLKAKHNIDLMIEHYYGEEK